MKPSKQQHNASSAAHPLEPVRFEFTRPTASAVDIAGPFNDWRPCIKPLHASNHGLWAASVKFVLLCSFLTAACARGAPIVIGYTNCLAVTNYSQSVMSGIGQLKWYFAHASVGINMMDGVAALHALNTNFYQIQSTPEDDFPPSNTTNGVIYEYMRGNPGWQAKVDSFQTYVSNGWRFPKVNLAINKFCYIDQTASLSYYLSSMTNLEAAFPETVFVYMTIPLMIYADSDNYLRNLFNDGVRNFVRANGRVLYDIADIQAHDPNGVLTQFTYNNRVCQALWSGYSTDGGHMNAAGGQLVANGFYAVAAALTPAARLSVTGITASDKVYDGTTSATLQTNNAALVGVQSGDQVTLVLTNASGTFDTKAAGIGKTVTISGWELVGPDAGNYTLTQPTTTATIMAATLTVSGMMASNKVYDGTTVAAIQSSGAALLGRVNGDEATLNTGGASGVFLDANVGIGKPVTVSGLAVGGADSSNYSLLPPAGVNADIGAASLRVRADAKQRLYGQTNPVLSASYSGFVNGETLETSGVSGNPSLNTTAATDSLPGIYPITLAIGSMSALNYGFSLVDGLLTVTGTHNGPSLLVQTNQVVAEMTTLTVTNTADYSDVPVSVLTYSLLDPPSGATIDTNGVITWTPTEAQGPSTNTITTLVTDNGAPALSATNSFTVVVQEVNTAPSLPVQTARTIVGLEALVVTNTASDSDLPANSLSYQLTSAPNGAVIDADGLITWTPNLGQVPSTNLFETIVTDYNPWASNSQNLNATNTFEVVVLGSVAPFPISSISLSNGVALVSWSAISGQTYRLQFKETLDDPNWQDVVPDIAPAGMPGGNTFAVVQDVVGDAPLRFYRVRLVK